MRKIAPTRKRTLFHDLKPREIKHPSPIVFCVKRAWSSSTAPLSIVCPTDRTVPPDCRYVFVDDSETTISQHSTHFVQHQARILRMMQHITKQHCIEALISDGKMPAVVGKVIDASRGAVADIQSNHSRSEHTLQMVRDETVAAANVQDVGVRRKHFGDFERHVVCSSDFAASSHSIEATLDGCG
jgi:hypothetical protein